MRGEAQPGQNVDEHERRPRRGNALHPVGVVQLFVVRSGSTPILAGYKPKQALPADIVTTFLRVSCMIPLSFLAYEVRSIKEA